MTKKWVIFNLFLQSFGWTLLVISTSLSADGLSLDAVYDPYVQPLEKELEYLGVYDFDASAQSHKVSYGQSINDRLFIEAAATMENNDVESSELAAAEIELKWQLSEQGEFAVDWGVLLELEREFIDNGWEAAVTAIATRQWGRWQGTANFALVAEWGSGVNNELETELNTQLKFRYQRGFEPGVEIHSGEDTLVFGPIITGDYKLTGNDSITWLAGIYTGLDSDSPDTSAKLHVEYEF